MVAAFEARLYLISQALEYTTECPVFRISMTDVLGLKADVSSAVLPWGL